MIKWLIFIAMFLGAFAVGGYILDVLSKRSMNKMLKKFRHLDDEAKQQATDAVEELYDELIMNEIRQ
ncbi:MAG: hypothetical protein NC397_01960 [Clostridium sp.]|nr:hypothetical protein [Clostridium sp.]